MLSLVDQGRENLNARVHYAPSPVVEYSPSAAAPWHRQGLTVGELCSATVSLSDNTAANVLLERHGGPAALTRLTCVRWATPPRAWTAMSPP